MIALAPLLLYVAGAGRQVPVPAPAGTLVVFNAGSLAHPIRRLFEAFTARYPRVRPQAETSGSIDVARKLTELGKIPDVVATADYAVIEQLLMPAFATWHVSFASNAMVVAYSAKSRGAGQINGANWIDMLRRPRIRVGRSNPALDPGGYRALMIFQLAERHYRRPGLAQALEHSSPSRFMRPKEVELVGLLEAGEIDYAIFYRSIAKQTELPFVDLPKEINLSDPTFASSYAAARVAVPKSRSSSDSLVFRGEPIVYAMTIPTRAANPAAARAFVTFVLGREGQRILTQSGFVTLPRPILKGDSAQAKGIVPP